MEKISVKELRLRHGLTQAELSRKIGVAPLSIIYWETGKTRISDLNRYKVAAFFNVHPDVIGGGVNEPPPER